MSHGLPGLFIEPSGKGGGLCGRQAATKTTKRIKRAPKAIPQMAALETEAAAHKTVKNYDNFLVSTYLENSFI